MKAHIAYLTTGPSRYFLNIQLEGNPELQTIEISRAHLANIIIDGASVILREDQFNRVPSTEKTGESANGRTGT